MNTREYHITRVPYSKTKQYMVEAVRGLMDCYIVESLPASLWFHSVADARAATVSDAISNRVRPIIITNI